jgi:hypothetical protein
MRKLIAAYSESMLIILESSSQAATRKSPQHGVDHLAYILAYILVHKGVRSWAQLCRSAIASSSVSPIELNTYLSYATKHSGIFRLVCESRDGSNHLAALMRRIDTGINEGGNDIGAILHLASS